MVEDSVILVDGEGLVVVSVVSVVDMAVVVCPVVNVVN